MNNLPPRPAPPRPRPDTPSAAQLHLAGLGLRSTSGAPVRREFLLRGEGGAPSPLGSILSSKSTSGGRGGRTRLALELSLLWVLSASPHTSRRPASWWAEVIGRPEGARAVSSSFRELEKRNFIVIKAGSGGIPATVTLLDERAILENGVPKPYARPGAVRGDIGHGYFRVPNEFWSDQLIGELDAAGIAMYLLLCYYFREESAPIWFPSDASYERHGLSPTTRTKGLDQLVHVGAVEMKQEWVESKKSDYGATRRRVYRLRPPFSPPKPTPINDAV